MCFSRRFRVHIPSPSKAVGLERQGCPILAHYADYLAHHLCCHLWGRNQMVRLLATRAGHSATGVQLHTPNLWLTAVG